MSIITYGILWKWIKELDPSDGNPLQRYSAFVLDEFSKLNPTDKRAARGMIEIIEGRSSISLWSTVRMVVTGYALTIDYMRHMGIKAENLIRIEGRAYTLNRASIVPLEGPAQLLETIEHLIYSIFRRDPSKRGDVVVFLPGYSEIMEMKRMLDEKDHGDINVLVKILHSEIVGEAGEEENVLYDESDPQGPLVVILSTVIGARTITYKSAKYVIIHPLTRKNCMSASGITRTEDVFIDDELEGNMAGRVGRVASGLCTFLYFKDDTKFALERLQLRDRTPVASDSCENYTIILGGPSRLYLVLNTAHKLISCGFPNVKWLCTPEAGHSNQENGIKTLPGPARVTAIWKMVVLPSILRQRNTCNAQKIFVVEDTVLLAPGVTFENINKLDEEKPACVWGYGDYTDNGNGNVDWHGTKGMTVTYEWCFSMQTILDNMHPADYGHWDIWLKNEQQKKTIPHVHLAFPHAGYGHRVSSSHNEDDIFGGAFIPHFHMYRANTELDMEEYTLEAAPERVERWVRLEI